ncbi:hypothetical protein BGZ80_008326 [Entomortierella chlamydospora]|uniref:Uncharacterized protein n=1 Tax=Entomortierella chlamydospora TaxID=101097 RepID=A0A9P6T179_9FUNG|nr:hypothetical protein BGZ80_008326 [Entomortierella chlamydospora]
MLWAGFLSVGSALSIPMMMMHTPYAILIAVSLALNPEADWSTWFPYAFTAILQAVLLGMCLFYYIKAKRKGHSSFLAVETTPLLRVAQENRGNESDPSAAHEDSARKQERTLRVDVDSELNIG